MFLYISHGKKFSKNRGALEEHRDIAWTTEKKRGGPRFNEPRFEKTAVLCVLTAVFIVAVIAGYMYRGFFKARFIKPKSTAFYFGCPSNIAGFKKFFFSWKFKETIENDVLTP